MKINAYRTLMQLTYHARIQHFHFLEMTKNLDYNGSMEREKSLVKLPFTEPALDPSRHQS